MPATEPVDPASVLEAADDLQQVVRRIERRYRGLPSFKVTFEQEYTSATFGSRDRAKGTVFVVPPTRMLWVYDEPEGQRGALNGEQYWLIDPEDREVRVRQRTGSDPLTELFAGRIDLAKVFMVQPGRSPAGAPGRIVLELVPREPREDIDRAVLEADRDDGTLRGLEIVDPMGNRFSYRFGSPRATPAPAASKFELTVPPGYTRTED